MSNELLKIWKSDKIRSSWMWLEKLNTELIFYFSSKKLLTQIFSTTIGRHIFYGDFLYYRNIKLHNYPIINTSLTCCIVTDSNNSKKLNSLISWFFKFHLFSIPFKIAQSWKCGCKVRDHKTCVTLTCQYHVWNVILKCLTFLTSYAA